MKIKFKKSPTGKYLLAYNAGAIVDAKNFDDKVVKAMLEDGTAEAVESTPTKSKATDKKAENRKTRKAKDIN